MAAEEDQDRLARLLSDDEDENPVATDRVMKAEVPSSADAPAMDVTTVERGPGLDSPQRREAHTQEDTQQAALDPSSAAAERQPVLPAHDYGVGAPSPTPGVVAVATSHIKSLTEGLFGSSRARAGSGEGQGGGVGVGGLLSSLVSAPRGRTESSSSSAPPPSSTEQPITLPSPDFRGLHQASTTLRSYLTTQPHVVRSLEVKLRPDANRSDILELFETTSLSHGLVVTSRTEDNVIMERPGGDRWSTVTVKLGVDAERQRVMILQFLAEPQLSTLSSQVATGANIVTPRLEGPIAAQLIGEIGAALLEGKLCMSTLDSEEEVVVSLDPYFVKDLQSVFAAEMMTQLQAYAVPLDEHVKEQELRCARLMTTLQPIYARASVPVPHPTRAKGLTAFPLDLARPSITEPSLEAAKKILARVQSTQKKERVLDVVKRVCRELESWCEEERQARVKRKRAQVLHRIKNAEQHRDALIKTLRDRPEVRLGPLDRQFSESFRFADEAVICDFPASHCHRPGRVYVTFSHLWFNSSIIGFALQRVMPFGTIKSIDLSALTPIGGRALVVTDTAGERVSFFVGTIAPPDYAERVLEVVSQVREAWRQEVKELDDVESPDPAADVLQRVDCLLSSLGSTAADGCGSSGRSSRGPIGEDDVAADSSPDGAASSPFAETVSAPVPSQATPLRDADVPRTPSPAGSGKPRSIRQGIQAFLQQEQESVAKRPGSAGPGAMLDLT